MEGDQEYSIDDLSALEKHLHDIIQNISDFKSRDPFFTDETRKNFRQQEVEFRQSMRTLRRWRNGTERTDAEDVRAFSVNLIRLKDDNVKLKMDVILDTITQSDSLLHALVQCPPDLISRRKNIECGAVILKSKVQQLENLNYDEYEECENNMNALQCDIFEFKKDIRDERKKKSKRKDSLRRASLRALIAAPKIEEHPEVNRVLKNSARIRRMIAAFKEGHHVITDEKDISECIENDLEVLKRQLRKIQHWQQSAETFSKGDVDDVELILSAIARHVLPDINLDSPIRRSSLSSQSSNWRYSVISNISFSDPFSMAVETEAADDSSSNDRTSNTSDSPPRCEAASPSNVPANLETSIETGTPPMYEAPPAYDEVYDDKKSDQSEKDFTDIGESSEVEIYNERLI